ncbi:MAG: h16 [Proteobacteria bacterium]|nr:h16 [Pseudomonadota bacterium]
MRSTLAVVRTVALGRLREQPLRLVVTVLAVALGVALATAVYAINSGALSEFGLAARKLVGEADVVVRGARTGFDEDLFVRLLGDASVEEASPALEIELAPLGDHPPLAVLAVDPFRAAAVQRELVAGLGGELMALFRPASIALSAAAATELGVARGDEIQVRSGSGVQRLEVVQVLPAAAYPQRLGLMDIATAQWAFDRVGRINRIDLRLAGGVDVARFRTALEARLPPGVTTSGPAAERDRAANVTRAYRVNLNMLAMVALLTGAFLVFSTQALSVLRRRSSLALLRALGATRRQVEAALLAEGILLGAAGSAVGVLVGQAVAWLALARLGGDLGGGYLHAVAVVPRPEPTALLGFFLLGLVVTAAGAWVPAREAARAAPARALKAGDAEHAARRLRPAWPGLSLAALGAACALLPPVGGLPVFGYASVALLLFAGMLLVPATAAWLLGHVPGTRRAVVSVALAQLKGSAGQSAVSLAAIIVSFSLMVAMAIMVYSFRESFERWLGEVLPADLHMRVAQAADTAFWSAADQADIAALDGVRRVEFARQLSVYLEAGREPVQVIARRVSGESDFDGLPLVRGDLAAAPPGTARAWISEPVHDLYGLDVGHRFTLPLAGKAEMLTVAGIWRDYGRPGGAIVVDRDWYVATTGDGTASQGAIWLQPGARASDVEHAVRAEFPRGDALQVYTGGALKEMSLGYFDRAFAVTYLLEAVAVLIGLVGVSFAFGSQALARRAEFGMLRHVGMLRRQVVGMLAGEGVVLGLVGVLYGLVLGFLLSLVLVYVVNRQSFNWSIDLAVPWLQLGALSVVLVASAGVTAALSGRAATGTNALRAVREDW